MRPRLPRFARGVVLGLALTGTLTATTTMAANAKDFKIGVIFDETGPFAGGGSKANLLTP